MWPKACIVMLSVPFSLTGGVWLMYLLGYNMSVAVGVGFIALAGVAAETGVVMLLYLDLAYKKVQGKIWRTGSIGAIFNEAIEKARPCGCGPK